MCMKCLWWKTPAGICTRLGNARSGGSPSKCPKNQETVGEKGCCHGGPVHCLPLNNGISFPRQPMLHLRAFLAMELLTPILVGCLCTAKSSCFPRYTLLTPHFITQLPPTLVASRPRWGTQGWFWKRLLCGQCMQGCHSLCYQRRLWWWQCSGPWRLLELRRPWLEGRASLLRWMPLPVPVEAGASRWGRELQ